jgi:hypothetical protein
MLPIVGLAQIRLMPALTLGGRSYSLIYSQQSKKTAKMGYESVVRGFPGGIPVP